MSMETKKENESTMNVEEKRTGIFARQPLSVLGKIAFWSFLVSVLGGIAGNIAIASGSGSVSLDLLTSTVISLIGFIFLATRFRWAPVVSTLLGGYLLYLVSIQPYVIESLVHPKTDPNGGFGHFAGVVLAIGLGLLAFGGSLGEAVQNYRNTSRRAPRWLPAALGLVVGLVIGALFIGGIVQESVASGTTYTNGVPTVHMGAGSFLQSSVTISKGSKLLLVDDVSALHIIANGTWENGVAKPASESGAPRVNNVQINGGSIQVGPFTTAGTYHIYCAVHQGMNLTIIVQ